MYKYAAVIYQLLEVCLPRIGDGGVDLGVGDNVEALDVNVAVEFVTGAHPRILPVYVVNVISE